MPRPRLSHFEVSALGSTLPAKLQSVILSDQSPISPDERDRLRQIEERTAFNEHTTDSLNTELLRLVRAVDTLAARMERLEGRLRTLDAMTSGEPDANDPLERPPHSAGPPIS